jgi:hypothetical protein
MRVAGHEDAMAGDDESKDTKPGTERRVRERRQRPPVTIDLTAEPVAAKAEEPAARPEPPKAEPAPQPPPASPAASAQRTEPPRATTPPGASAIGSDDNWTRLALAAAAGGLVALVLGLGLQGIGLLPSPGRSAALAAADQAKAATEATAALDRRIAAIEMMTQSLPARGAFDALSDRVGRIEAAQSGFASSQDLASAKEELAKLSAALAALPATATADQLAALAQRVSRLESGGTGGEPGAGAVAALSGRIDTLESGAHALEQRIAALERRPPGSGDTLAARAIAVVALQRAADGAAPFPNDLALAAALGLPEADVAALKPFADKGAPTRASLAADFPAVGDAIIRTSVQSDPNASFFDRLIAGVTGLVSVRPAGPVAGNDPSAIVSRMRAAVDKGDLPAALKEREALSDVGKAASADWARGAADRAALDAIIARISSAVGEQGGKAPT